MSEFLSSRLKSLQPYLPGEQPREREYLKLNTNENPYYLSRMAADNLEKKDFENLRLYSDPDCTALRNEIAMYYGIDAENVLPTNGSDEALAFCFAAFCGQGAVFPDVTYGFYKVIANLLGIEFREIPLCEDFTVKIQSYFNAGKTIFLANPNAQTGIGLPLEDIENIVAENPRTAVIVDEAYIDFGGESAARLIRKYRNLVVVQTFSKSRSLAGARVGFAMANQDLISDLKRVKDSFNPYNVNSVSAKLALSALRDDAYFKKCTAKIIATRDRLVRGLQSLGFCVLPSAANFVLAEHATTDGETLYRNLKSRGILVRHFSDERIRNFIRITVGTDAQTEILLKTLKELTAI